MAQSKQVKMIFVILAIFIIIVAGYVLFAKDKNFIIKTGSENDKENNVQVKQVDLNTANIKNVLPENFPPNIPIETEGIFESYSVVYKTQGVTQYTVSYISTKTKNLKWDEYSLFMTKENYKYQDTTNKKDGILSGSKDNGLLSVIISERDNKTVVQLSFVVKQ